MGYMCCYCDDRYQEPAELKKHTLVTHEDVRTACFLNVRMDGLVVRLDITSLQCKICNQSIETLEELMQHLKIEHKKTIYTDIKNHITPLKFLTDTLQCCICTNTFAKFKMLLEHMNTHYRNYICNVCDAGFAYNSGLRTHMNHSHDPGALEENNTVNKDKSLRDVKKDKKASQRSNKTPIVLKLREIDKHRTNIKEVIRWSNATPIRRHEDMGYMCCYCDDYYQEPAELKKHTLDIHQDVLTAYFMHIRMDGLVVRLDITSLRCKICYKSIETLEELMQHLKIEHQKTIYTDIKNHITPFKFVTESLQCCICMNTFAKFKMLLEHMNTHYRNYICKICDAGFAYNSGLRTHRIHSHNAGTFKCHLCSLNFESSAKKKAHDRIVHDLKQNVNKCGFCNETFSELRFKEAHLVSKHGLKVLESKCQACDKVFKDRKSLSLHVKRDHLLERRHTCSQCDMKFFKASDLKCHMLKHTGLRHFKCTVCAKAFCRPDTLKGHMKIHKNIRRFKCEHCGQAFVQKCSWRGHMKSKHGEIV